MKPVSTRCDKLCHCRVSRPTKLAGVDECASVTDTWLYRIVSWCSAQYCSYVIFKCILSQKKQDYWRRYLPCLVYPALYIVTLWGRVLLPHTPCLLESYCGYVGARLGRVLPPLSKEIIKRCTKSQCCGLIQTLSKWKRIFGTKLNLSQKQDKLYLVV